MSLHVHSEYSSLDGWSRCEEIADRAVELGCGYCGLTDHGVVAGHIEFDKAMRAKDLNPVFGCELYHGVNFGVKGKERDQSHLIALAMTDEGLRNLWRLVHATARKERFHYVGRVSNEDISKYKEGIIFTSACALGLVPKGIVNEDTTQLEWYLRELGDNFRIEVSTYAPHYEFDDGRTTASINKALVDIATEKGITITYGDDGHYAFPWQFPYHDLYLAKQTKATISTPTEERKMYHPEGAVCIKDMAMVRESLAHLGDLAEEIIQNTHEIGRKANAKLPHADRPHLPVFIPKKCPWIAEEKDATELFEELVATGIDERYAGSEREEEAWEKAVHEVDVLTEDGLEHYFLMTWDIVEFCRKEGIAMGPGRGSSAGSIVAYALGITDVDPLHYDLFFERFWNKGRAKGFPDIDSDFARSRRPEIREYLMGRYGKKRVCSIGTVKRMKPISVMNALAGPCDIQVPELFEIKKIVEETHDIIIHGPEQIGWNPEIEPGKVIYVKEDVGEEIEKWIKAEREPERRKFIEMCEQTCSRIDNYGIHPSGIVVSDIDLDDYAPAYLRSGKDEGTTEKVPATQFPMATIEKLLLIKEDVLGLKTLDTLSEWTKLMSDKDIEISWSGLDREDHPEEMWDLLSEGFVAGVFQIETTGGRLVCEQLRPRSIEDLGVLNALNRPGPMRAGIPARYVARKEGRSEVTYPHPMLEEILKPTYGLFVYQEQIIRFMWALGYSKSDADEVRKILGKKQPERLAALFAGEGEWEGKGWLTTAVEKGFDEKVAQDLWEELEGFASYSFNKSHAIAYGIIAFRCLFAKYYSPAEFYIACIRTVEHSKRAELTPEYIKEARRSGIKVLPPDIRYSQADIDEHEGQIYFGFSDIKGVSSAGVYLTHLRDDLGFDVSDPFKLLAQIEQYNEEQLEVKKELHVEGKLWKGWKSPKQQINERKITMIAEAGAWDFQWIRPLKEKQKAELEYLNVILTDNTEEILEANHDAIEECDLFEHAATPWDVKEHEFEFEEDVQKYLQYRVPGIITKVKPTKVKATGKPMGIVTIEYGRHELTFACFSDKWEANRFLFKPHNVCIFTIRHSPASQKRMEGYIFEKGHLLKL